MTENRTIVTGYDGSAASRAAVEHAVTDAGPGGRIVVVHAYEVPPDYMGAPYYNDMLSHEASRTAKQVEELEAACPALTRVEHESEVIAGDAGDAILRIAGTRGADEIVLGSRGRGRLGSWLLGSVAQKVIHGATCPVLVIPEGMVPAG